MLELLELSELDVLSVEVSLQSPAGLVTAVGARSRRCHGLWDMSSLCSIKSCVEINTGIWKLEAKSSVLRRLQAILKALDQPILHLPPTKLNRFLQRLSVSGSYNLTYYASLRPVRLACGFHNGSLSERIIDIAAFPCARPLMAPPTKPLRFRSRSWWCRSI